MEKQDETSIDRSYTYLRKCSSENKLSQKNRKRAVSVNFLSQNFPSCELLFQKALKGYKSENQFQKLEIKEEDDSHFREIEYLKSNISELNQEIDSKELIIQELEFKFKEFEKESEKHENRIEELVSQNQRMILYIGELEENKNETFTFKQELSKVKELNEREMSRITNTVVDMESRNKQYLKEIEKMRKELDTKNKENESLKKKYEIIKSDNEILLDEMQSYINSQKSKFEKEVTTFQEDCEKILQEKIDEISQLKLQNEDFSVVQNEFIEEREKLENLITELNEKHLNEIEEFKKTEALNNEEISNLKTDVKLFKENSITKDTEIIKIRSDNIEFQQIIELKKSEISKKEKQINDLVSRLEKMNNLKIIPEECKICSEYLTDNQQLAICLKKKDIDISSLIAKCEYLQNQINNHKAEMIINSPKKVQNHSIDENQYDKLMQEKKYLEVTLVKMKNTLNTIENNFENEKAKNLKMNEQIYLYYSEIQQWRRYYYQNHPNEFQNEKSIKSHNSPVKSNSSFISSKENNFKFGNSIRSPLKSPSHALNRSYYSNLNESQGY